MKKRILTIILSALLLGTSLIGLPLTPSVSAADIDQPKPIEDIFPDAAFASAVANVMGKNVTDTVTQADLNTVTQITAPNASINNLEGVEYLNYLIDLGVGGNNISDLTPLTGSTVLKELYLSNNNITDISPLSGLTYLQVLTLYGNNITDISPLSGLTKITNLDIGNNGISDISALAGMTQMDLLYIDNNQISDISPLAGLTNMQTLDMSNNLISDIWPLATAASLQSLAMGSNAISDVSSIANLGIRMLKMPSNQIMDLSSLGTMFSTYTWLGTLDSQNAVLYPVTICDPTNTVTITNNVYMPDGTPVPINDADISDGGTYDLATNTITWTNVTADTDFTYSFSTSVNLVFGPTTFSGTVTQPVYIGYGYEVQYYENSADPANLITTDIVSTPYTTGYQLTEADVDTDLGNTWLNSCQPGNCQSGVASYPVISANSADNVVVVIYAADPAPTPAPVNPGQSGTGTKKLILPKTGTSILPLIIGFAAIGTLSIVKGLKKSK